MTDMSTTARGIGDVSRALFDLLPLGISILDGERRIVDFNPALGRILGMTADGLRGGAYRNRTYLRADGSEMPPEEFPSAIALREGRQVQATIVGVRKEDGAVVWTEVCAAPLPGGEARCVVVTEEVGDRLAAVRALQASEQKYKNLSGQLEAIFDNIPGSVFYKDRDNRLIRVNKYVADAYGKSKAELEGVSLYDIYPADDARRAHQDDLAVMESGKARLDVEEQWATPDGPRWVSTSKIPLFDDAGAIQGIIGISMDITERKKSDLLIQELILRLEAEKDKAQRSAVTDGLTGIPNRRFFDETLDKELFRLKRTGSPLALLMIDIDYFKKYNDRYGHVQGDECLKRVADAIVSNIERAPDFAARYGGEEFAVVMPDTDVHGAMIVAERLRKAVEDLRMPHADSTLSDYVTISLGLASAYPETIESPDELVRLADHALYQAKNAGRNRIAVAEETETPAAGGAQDGGTFIRLVWHASHQCGNETIDRQHRKLFALSNKLLSMLVSGKQKDACAPALESLLGEVEVHFRDEEAILESIGYPEIDEHRVIHRNLLAHARELASLERAGRLSTGDLFNFLADEVIARHMFQDDKKFFQSIV